MNFLDEYEGLGTENLNTGIPFLSITQKAREEQPDKKLGQWWHSSLNKALGKKVKVIPISWRNVWVEKNQNGRTIAYHREQSIQLKQTGSEKTFRITNKETGNRVDCTFMVLCLLPEEPDSLCFLMPSVKSLHTMREWRKALTLNRLPSGKKAPIFSNVWELSIQKVSDGNEYYIIGTIELLDYVSETLFLTGIQPLLESASEPFALLPSIVATASEEEEERYDME
jgi:hypothetical protein